LTIKEIINIIIEIFERILQKMLSELSIGISIILISIIIYVAKNKDICVKYINTIKDKKVTKIISNIVIIMLVVLFVISIFILIKQIYTNIDFYKTSRENNILFDEFDKKVQKEMDFYEEAVQKEYGTVKKEPYIPENFKYVEGNIETGYVIEDLEKNQYVWIPCTNKDNEDIVKLQKMDFSMDVAIKNDCCLDIEYEDFIESAFKYGGFYISRFELGQENEKIVSKPNVKILTDISRTQVIEKLNNLYSNLNCKLINGYAYDTTLAWIKRTNDFKIDKINTEKTQEVLTGRSKNNNIYDFTDNIMELTLEDFYDTIIYRGFDYGNVLELESRYNKSEQDIYKIKTMNIIGFRSVIYK